MVSNRQHAYSQTVKDNTTVCHPTTPAIISWRTLVPLFLSPNSSVLSPPFSNMAFQLSPACVQQVKRAHPKHPKQKNGPASETQSTHTHENFVCVAWFYSRTRSKIWGGPTILLRWSLTRFDPLRKTQPFRRARRNENGALETHTVGGPAEARKDL